MSSGEEALIWRPLFGTARLPLPPEWEDHSVLTFVRVRPGGPQVSLTITRSPVSGIELEAWVREQLGQLARALPAFRLIALRACAHPAGAGQELELGWRRGDRAMRQLQLFLPGPGAIYVLTASTAAEDYPREEAELRRLLAAFRPEAPPGPA